MLQDLIACNTPMAIALALVATLSAWRVKPKHFRALSWPSIGIASTLFWGVFSALLIPFAWSFYYRFFVPSWYLYAAPAGAIALYSALGLLMRWAALRLPGNPNVVFCLLGGLESIPEHAIGIYGFDILQVPVLRGSTAASIFLFAYFEYVVYWGAVLWLAIVVDRWLAVRRMRAAARQERPQDASG